MSKKNKGSSGYSGSSFVNLACLIAIVLAIIIYVLQLIYHFTDWSFIGSINGILTKVKDVLLFVVVFMCGIRYALSMNDTKWRTTLIVLCVIFAVLFIIGIILL